MGFATTENIIYVLNGDGGTAILRMFSAVPAHTMFAVIMGFYVGEDKIVPAKVFLYSIFGLVAATAFHELYDYFLFVSFKPGIWIGAIVSIVLAYFLSQKAIKIHQAASPFKNSEN